MQLRLQRRAESEDTVILGVRTSFDDRPLRLSYPTRTGALLRIDGNIAGAFDSKHRDCVLSARPGEYDVTLEVERRSLPVSGLPSGDGIAWRLMLARATETPHETLELTYVDGADPARATLAVPAIGHSHLDIAWLWRYADTRRKALRTFATAIRQVERYPFVFAQSQPQLYSWVASDDPALFARVRARIGRGFDASVATMWVEPDLHAPSGESILRQFAYGMRFARETLGANPAVVWLPDTFGFPNTLPQLAVHAGARAFATTKLQWNDTTRWPFPQFVWRGDDGSELRAAVIDAYDGDTGAARVRRARERSEPLVIGYGDGGGGARDEDIAQIIPAHWTPLDAWFQRLEPGTLPAYTGELYLETHRGTYTTHRDVKSRNAALERALEAAEEAVAWCVAVRVSPSVVRPLTADLQNAWTIVLRNQFHDVISGTSIPSVYLDVHAEYDRADRIVGRVREGALSVLPRGELTLGPAPVCPPLASDDAYLFENDFVRAHVRSDGTIDEFRAVGGPNVAALLNGLAAYVDKPKAWDAWNLDRTYADKRVDVKPQGAGIEDGALVVRFTIGKRSRATMQLSLLAGEPYLRIELAVAWHEDHVVLRSEHRIAVAARAVRYGQPHGSIVRTAYAETDAERAKFEVPAQRWMLVDDGQRGCALLAPDTYGWNAHGLPSGGIRAGMSLLRSPRWPDPSADRGEHRIAYALAPTAGALPSALEGAWHAYTTPSRVRLFEPAEPNVLVAATKPADDGRGVIVRVRECDGEARAVALRCGGRMRVVECVDACESPVAGEVRIDGEELHFHLPPFTLRSFRVEF
ncbi:MAG: hypothetical protein NVS3B28_08240 [Candidatus Velthaea sp.]